MLGAERDRFSTATRLRAIGEQAAARVYRARSRRLRTPRRSRLTGRAAVLALVVCTLAVALIYPTRQYVSQRAEIAEQRQEAERARREVEQLRQEKVRWRDPAYVEQQARRRLHYVRPGEIEYILENRSGDATDSAADGGGERNRGASGRAWYQNLWDGVDTADRPADAG